MNLDALRRFQFPALVQSYDHRDLILYALGLGYGTDPLDRADLRYLHEGGLQVVPSVVNVLAHPGLWVSAPELELNWKKLLHVSQGFEILRPLAAKDQLSGRYIVTGVEDLGVERGARLALTKELLDPAGQIVARVNSVYLLRSDGGCGSFGHLPPRAAPLPPRAPDLQLSLATSAQQALLYRMSGDWNPLHTDPEVAAAAGFARPILQGLCSMGMATRALIRAVANGAPERLQSLSLRFTRPVTPGDLLHFDLYQSTPLIWNFRARVAAGDETVLDGGEAIFHPA